MTPLLQKVYGRFIAPTSEDEDIRRREFIFTVMLIGTITLTVAALTSRLCNTAPQRYGYEDWPPAAMLVPLLVLIGLYLQARHRFSNGVIYPLLTLYLFLGTIMSVTYGYDLPEGLLAYMLVIILTGLMLSARAAAVMTGIIMICLSFLSYLQLHQILKPDVHDLAHPFEPIDVFVYLFVFSIILLASWLSNRDIELSLLRARTSEAALRQERNNLEIKVRQRTHELEKAQIEKLLELHRFAEFGRMSAALLHDLASPLMVVSLNLEQLASRRQSALVEEAKKGITHMERYVTAARRQLQFQTETKDFIVADEIKQVVELLDTKARISNVHIRLKLDEPVQLHGDSIQFDHIIANLVANAIDAYETIDKPVKIVTIQSQKRSTSLLITVTDHGVGIKQRELEHVFEAFYTTKDNEHGTGIGLAIVKQAVEADFSGTISATSSTAAGTCFSLRIPLTSPIRHRL